MHRWLALLLALAVTAFTSAAQDKAAEDTERKEELHDLKIRYRKAREAALLAYRRATSDAERADAVRRISPPTTFLVQAFAIVSAAPKDAVSFEALKFASEITGGEHSKVIAL